MFLITGKKKMKEKLNSLMRKAKIYNDFLKQEIALLEEKKLSINKQLKKEIIEYYKENLDDNIDCQVLNILEHNDMTIVVEEISKFRSLRKEEKINLENLKVI